MRNRHHDNGPVKVDESGAHAALLSLSLIPTLNPPSYSYSYLYFEFLPDGRKITGTNWMHTGLTRYDKGIISMSRRS